jgi:hypothetical protein
MNLKSLLTERKKLVESMPKPIPENNTMIIIRNDNNEILLVFLKGNMIEHTKQNDIVEHTDRTNLKVLDIKIEKLYELVNL